MDGSSEHHGCQFPATAAIVQTASSDRIVANGFDPCCKIGDWVSGQAARTRAVHLHGRRIDENRRVAGKGQYQASASVPTGTAYRLTVG